MIYFILPMSFQCLSVFALKDVHSVDAYTKTDRSNVALVCPYDKFAKISNSPSSLCQLFPIEIVPQMVLAQQRVHRTTGMDLW